MILSISIFVTVYYWTTFSKHNKFNQINKEFLNEEKMLVFYYRVDTWEYTECVDRVDGGFFA